MSANTRNGRCQFRAQEDLTALVFSCELLPLASTLPCSTSIVRPKGKWCGATCRNSQRVHTQASNQPSQRKAGHSALQARTRHRHSSPALRMTQHRTRPYNITTVRQCIQTTPVPYGQTGHFPATSLSRRSTRQQTKPSIALPYDQATQQARLKTHGARISTQLSTQQKVEPVPNPQPTLHLPLRLLRDSLTLTTSPNCLKKPFIASS